MNQSERRIFLINKLIKENNDYKNITIPANGDKQKLLLRALMNVRMPKPTSKEFLNVQDEYLKDEIRQKGITDYKNLTPIEKNIYLWQGDITTLKCDAAVNAANSKMLGCFCPNHGCIDNAIHTFAGIELRLKCDEIMKAQGCDEKTGNAKITPAYNLPCNYIIHTVGPIIENKLTNKDCELLRKCYISCIKTAIENNLKSIAFCCISTGEFGFPNEKAAEIAISTVKEFINQTNAQTEVIFNVYKNKDYNIYKRLLTENQQIKK